MLGKKLISFLSLLSRNELDLFSKFLMSPYHTEQKNLLTFYEFIKPSIQKGIVPPSKLLVWDHLYPKQPFKDNKIRKLASALLQLAVSFKSFEILNHQKEQKLLLELKAVSHPQLQTHIASLNRKLELLLEQDNHSSAEAHFYSFELEAQNHRILESEKDLKKIIQLKNLQKANRHLEIFFLSKKLEIYADALGYQGFTELPPSLNPTEQFLQIVKQESNLQEPAIHVYFLIVAMLSAPESDTHFYNLKKWVLKNEQYFSKTQNKTFYTHLLNFCIQQRINTGDQNFYKEAFDIFKLLVEKDLIFDPYIDPSYYRNIITNGLRLKEYDYVENFIQTYSAKLPTNQKENAKTYNLARLFYIQKNYDKVIGLLHNVELTNVSYALGAKTILVGTYFALDEIRALESLLVSFRIFVLRNKLITAQAKQGYLNFLKFTKKLIYLAPFDKAGYLKLKTKINNTQNLMVSDWLLEQVELKIKETRN